MISVSAFVRKVEEIAARDLKYRIGGVGKDGTCDCIGLIMGAMVELGHEKYDLHSTNYFARYQVDIMRRVGGPVWAGEIVFRSRTSTDKLNARYQAGGRYYTGTLIDYYHVGVILSVDPLVIVECTEYDGHSGILQTTSIDRWEWVAQLQDVDYGGFEETNEDGGIERMKAMQAQYQALVTTNKSPLNVREWAKTGTVLGDVPKGRMVDVLIDDGDGWPLIRYNELVGYASGDYLTPVPKTEVEEETHEKVEVKVPEAQKVTIIDSEGNHFEPVGDFRVLFGSID